MNARLIPPLLGVLVIAPAPALAADVPRAAAARVQSASLASPQPRARAPTKPPLGTSGTGSEGAEEASAPSEADGDALIANGLASPLCSGRLEAGALSGRAQRNCSDSGFVASAAPTGDFGLDVHIDTGLLGLSKGGLQSVFQDVVIAPVWTALVWVVHAICVMLEWCFTLDLLDSAAAGGLGSGLRRMQDALTQPWLVTVLAIAGVGVLYNGLVRRRVAETVGEAALMTVMIVGGLWAIADPIGTVGALGRWANQASVGTLAVASRGTPRGAASSLAESMQTVFAAAIEAPWCYLEFGNVDWCREAGRLDPTLRSAGLKIASAELQAAGCPSDTSPIASCTGAAAAQAQTAERSARLLREAQTNGAIFLALPPNGPARNSINEEGSLLRALCGSDEATHCHGATAAEAEFRTGSGTLPRLVGLLFILAGALGMIMLLCFIALRLLGAAVFSLLFLLLAPGMVLAPALGDGGRGVFRKWLMQLLGAVVSKLLFSFLLGVLLAVLAILASLQALGWWTQWLLMSAFWWGVFIRRHHALALAEGSLRGGSSRQPLQPRPTLTRRLGRALESRKGWAAARWAYGRRSRREAPELAPPHAPPPRPPAAPSASTVGAGRISTPHASGEALPRAANRRTGAEEQDPRQARLERVREEQSKAEAAGERRRAIELKTRASRIEGELAQGVAASVPSQAPGGKRRSPVLPARGQDPQRPTGVPPREHMQPPDPERRRQARLEIDREIALRRDAESGGEAAQHGTRGGSSGAPSPAPRRADAAAIPRDHADRELPKDDPAGESSVMRDIREVEAGRKRQLGFGRE